MDPDQWAIIPSSFAEKVYQQLPPSAKELRCKCTSRQPRLMDRQVLLCATCRKLPRYCLAMDLKECEGCEEYYVQFRIPGKSWPETARWGLCDRCTSKVRPHGTKSVTKRFKQS